MWPFGRKRELADETRCASCGRTLLAGEWTQRMIADDGSEVLLCSLCNQSRASRSAAAETAMVDGEPAPVNGRDTKRRSDAFWLALKEKDAEIADLRTRLERIEAEKKELLAELVVLRRASDAARVVAEPELDGVDAALASEQELDGAGAELVSEQGPEGADEELAFGPELEAAATGAVIGGAQLESAEAEAAARPAEDETVAAMADAAAAGVAAEGSPQLAADEPREGDLDDTLPGTLTGEQVLAAEGAAAAVVFESGEAADEEARAWPIDTTSEEYLSDEELHLVQRGVDILNVSAVPKKVAETSASLGVPFVHVAVEPDASISVTYVWPLGWYRFSVLTEGSGHVRLAERGYEELAELQPNGTVRSDGTVQLAPTFGKRPTPREETAADVEPSVSTASVTSGVIISKSLMGQRTDDEAVVPWESQNARDFDWGR